MGTSQKKKRHASAHEVQSKPMQDKGISSTSIENTSDRFPNSYNTGFGHSAKPQATNVTIPSAATEWVELRGSDLGLSADDSMLLFPTTGYGTYPDQDSQKQDNYSQTLEYQGSDANSASIPRIEPINVKESGRYSFAKKYQGSTDDLIDIPKMHPINLKESGRYPFAEQYQSSTVDPTGPQTTRPTDLGQNASPEQSFQDREDSRKSSHATASPASSYGRGG